MVSQARQAKTKSRNAEVDRKIIVFPSFYGLLKDSSAAEVVHHLAILINNEPNRISALKARRLRLKNLQNEYSGRSSEEMSVIGRDIVSNRRLIQQLSQAAHRLVTGTKKIADFGAAGSETASRKAPEPKSRAAGVTANNPIATPQPVASPA